MPGPSAWPVLTGPDAPRSAVRIMDGVLTVLAFVISVTWMDATAGELVALLAAVGKLSGVSETLLGATVLAWGNSVGDMAGAAPLLITRRYQCKSVYAPRSYHMLLLM